MRGFWLALAAFAALMGASGRADAELRLVVAETPDHMLVLENRPAEIQAELIAVVENGSPMFDVVECESLIERLLPAARASAVNMDVIIAQYNLVSLWLGDICPGTSTEAITPAEARAWLDELAGLRRSSDGAPFLRSRELLLEFYLFGAPGYQPDYAAARTFLESQSTAPGFSLYAAYMAARGLGGASDQAQSVALLRSAADAGDRTASALLAQALEQGLGVEKNEAAAAAMYQDIAQRISTPVWYRLGMMYLEGRGVERDACAARSWLRQAATHAWSPVPAANAALERIATERACP
jgi:TPR repeat protein